MAVFPPSFGSPVIGWLARIRVDLSFVVIVAALMGPDITGLLMICNKLLLDLSADPAVLEN